MIAQQQHLQPQEQGEEGDSDLPREGELRTAAVFSFDEVSLRKSVEFDQKEEKVYGPHGNVQVGMIRGLFSKFKQPVFYDFDAAMEPSILYSIHNNLAKIGIQIVAVVSDMGTKNVRLWNQLSVSQSRPFFILPSGEKVNVFADVPHLLKLLRNHFLDQGYQLPNGTRFTKDDLLQLLEKDSGELRLCHKLKPIHFLCKGSQRQRVILAAQLFSHSVASALRLLFPQKEELANFIDLVNSCFDIFNARTLKSAHPLDCGYGFKLEEQYNILCKAKKMFQEIRAVGKKSMLPWQKGWVMSIDSLIDLYARMQKDYSAKFLLTARLNQDCLENFFSRIRYSCGSSDACPGPVEFKIRFKNIVLGQSADIVVKSAAVLCDREEEDSSTKMLSVLLLEGLQKRKEKQDDKDTQEETNLEGGAAAAAAIVAAAEATPGRIDPDDSTRKRGREEDDDEPVVGSLLAAAALGNRRKETESGKEEHNMDCTEEALKYIAGFLAFKMKTSHPEMSATNDEKISAPPCPWIDQYSYGALTKPSEEWFERMKKFEKVFKSFHGEGISREKGIIRCLQEVLLREFPYVPKDVLNLYAKTRTHIRIKYLKTKNVCANDTRNQKKMRELMQ